MQKLLTIDCVMYQVKDIKKSIQVYLALGMTKRWEDTDRQMVGFTFPNSDSEIVIHTDTNIPNGEVCFKVENVEAMCREWKEQGYSVLLEPIPVRTGNYAVLGDRDNNALPIIDLTTFSGTPRYDS